MSENINHEFEIIKDNLKDCQGIIDTFNNVGQASLSKSKTYSLSVDLRARLLTIHQKSKELRKLISQEAS